MNQLCASTRDIREKAKKARKVGKLPGILYGGSRGNVPFYVNVNEFRRYVNRNGERGILYIDLNGQVIKTQVLSVQRDLADNSFVNIDLKEIEEDIA